MWLLAPAVVWSIAGSDSGAGAGVEADLRTMRCLGTFGCAVVTALTAQTSTGVRGIEPTSPAHVRLTLDALASDMPAAAIKVGMLCNGEVATEVAAAIEKAAVPVVVDPVMLSSSGRRLLDARGLEVLAQRIAPACAVLTPNAREAEVLLGLEAGSLLTLSDAVDAARSLRNIFGCDLFLKGGHLGMSTEVVDVFVDDSKTMILRGPRSRNEAHGTGCVLSSAMAAFLAKGETRADAAVAAKALCAEAIAGAVAVGPGPPAALTPPTWPARPHLFPLVGDPRRFPRIDGSPPRLYALANSAARAAQLFEAGVGDVQLRIKDPAVDIAAEVRTSLASARGGRLWVNDHWLVAVQCGAYGVHLGQEDLADADLDALERSGLRLGVSTHSYEELARALAVRPSYVAFGPVFGTASKKIRFSPRGTAMVRAWRAFVPRDTPLVTIGGISLENAPAVLDAGADSIAVISVGSADRPCRLGPRPPSLGCITLAAVLDPRLDRSLPGVTLALRIILTLIVLIVSRQTRKKRHRHTMGGKSLQNSHPKKYGKGSRRCRVCGNQQGIIRKYNINCCRQCFRQYASDIGFVKYN
ncbi:hypothetical protein CTAYLR_000072 [Chrysophaeum taylorii]|uniref:Thiamine-phosphate pyrophosphorylase n=1 Tax=Chrysophaeum taylorii TaxID=2483200 RepID=A0AAD7UGL8_9STRA|nr:hypothetical protein CTAYLR_000072 [Chrysophaeum taylorii]